jgi:hypothetical protein
VKYSIDIYNLTNHPSFDIPIDNVDQNLAFSAFPVEGSQVLPTGCTGNSPNDGFYFCPTGLGQTVHTIGSSRQVQMSLSVQF